MGKTTNHISSPGEFKISDPKKQSNNLAGKHAYSIFSVLGVRRFFYPIDNPPPLKGDCDRFSLVRSPADRRCSCSWPPSIGPSHPPCCCVVSQVNYFGYFFTSSFFFFLPFVIYFFLSYSFWGIPFLPPSGLSQSLFAHPGRHVANGSARRIPMSDRCPRTPPASLCSFLVGPETPSPAKYLIRHNYRKNARLTITCWGKQNPVQNKTNHRFVF